MKQQMVTGLMFALCFVVILGCSQFSSPEHASISATQPENDSIDEILAKLCAAHPDGIPVDAAQTAMQANGYQCQIKTRERFRYQPQGEHRTTMPETDEMDYLECFQKSQSGWVTSFYTVALVIEDGVITDTFTRMEAVGP